MPDPFRMRVKKALCQVLEEITPAEGYVSDLSEFTHDDGAQMKRVYRGRAFFGDNDPLPMVAILERPESPDEAEPPVFAMKKSYDWHLIVQGFVSDDKDDPTDEADILLADVKIRLAKERARKDDATGRRPNPFGMGEGKNRVEELSFGPGIVRPADEISARAYFWLGVSLKTIEDPLFPFD